MDNSFIPPDYSDAKEIEFPDTSIEEDEDDIVEDIDLDEEELNEHASIYYENEAVTKQNQENERIMATPSPFGAPGNTSPFGAPSPSP